MSSTLENARGNPQERMLTKFIRFHHPTIGGVRLASVLKLIKYNVQHRRWALIRSGKRTRQRRGKRTFYVRILRLGIQVFLRIMRTSWIPRCLNKPYSTYKFLRRQLIYPGARDSLSVSYSSPMRNICCWSPRISSEAVQTRHADSCPRSIIGQ